MSSGSSLVVGTVVEGVVKGITRFGAFVELPDGQTGLVHISEVANTFVRDISDFLKEQDKVQVKILFCDGNKIGLSIKQAQPGYRPEPRRAERRTAPRSLDDMLAKFLRDSEEKQSTLRRRQAGRGGKGGFGGPR